MQKNLPLLKVPDQSMYYSRRLYFYNLSIVTVSSSLLSNKSVAVYSWCEHEMQKSSNQISSTVLDNLCEKIQTGELDSVKTVRLVADGCPGQNKNSSVMTMCCFWLFKHAPINTEHIELIFPVTGHSFLPSDRVFGLLEKELKTKSTIVEVDDYHEVFSKYRTLKLLGKDWVAYDWKQEAKEVVKPTQNLHFQLSKCKRLIMKWSKSRKNILVSGEMNYNLNLGSPLSITKKKQSFSSVNPKLIPLGC